MRKEVDLREAVNAVSDVVQNRPRPLRVFDQIYMKTGDMVVQSEIVADWADGKSLAFIGDGDAVSVCVAYLKARNVFDFGPTEIMVFDFDERMVKAIKRFASREGLENLDAQLYNCLDAFNTAKKYDCFYTNPPWGASNNGESVNVFAQRGIEAIQFDGSGMIVIADDDDLDWPKQVLSNVQRFTADHGFYVSRMQRKLHEYHLDDAPDLRSCNLFISSLPANGKKNKRSEAILDPGRLKNFYGQTQEPRVRYIKEKSAIDYGKASEQEYELIMLESG